MATTDDDESALGAPLSDGQGDNGLSPASEIEPAPIVTRAGSALHFDADRWVDRHQPPSRQQGRVQEGGRGQTAQPYGKTIPIKHQSINHWLLAQSRETPEGIAVVYSNENPDLSRCLTYRDLNQRSNQLAHYLISAGVTQETLVGIMLERSVDLIVAFLGILRAGAAYVPLDPGYPAQRLSTMVHDSGMALLVTDLRSGRRLPEFAGRTVLLDRDGAEIAAQSPVDIPIGTGPDSLACVIYTSGSTGAPKGVMLEHRNLCNAVVRAQDQFGLRPGMRVAQFASTSFVMSVGDIFSALCSGATLVLGDRAAMTPGDPLTRFLNDNRIDVICMAASSAALLSPAQLPGLKHVLVAGEACASDVMRRWAQGGRNFIIGYGMTEMTGGATTKRCGAEDLDPVLGGPNPNTCLYILDEKKRPVPIGVTGEIYLGGAGLARGYLNDPARTAETFIKNPFGDAPEDRLVRTGDLGCYLENGDVKHMGRADFQINIRGFRIEPGDVETVLNQHPQITRAVVAAKRDPAGNTRLVAFVQPDAAAVPTIGDVRSYALARLPEYMVPANFIFLSQLPQTPNGKLDRLSLPELTAELLEQSGERHVQAKTDVEARVTAAFQEILGASGVSIDDNFFEIGADSLMLARISDRLQAEFKVALPVIKLFEFPTIRLLGKHLEARLGAATGDAGKSAPDRKVAAAANDAPNKVGVEAQVIVLSARDQDRLRAYARTMATALRAASAPEAVRPLSLASVAYTLQLGRKEMEVRLAFVAAGLDATIETLTAFAETKADTVPCFSGDIRQPETAAAALLRDWEGDAERRSAYEQRDLTRLARVWVAGGQVDWRMLYAAVPRRVPLPTYPFRRERHSLEAEATPEPSSPAAFKAPPLPPGIGQVIFASDWVRAELDARSDAGTLRGDILIFAEDDHLCRAVRVLVPPTSRVTLVTPGGAFERVADDHYAIDPSRAEDYQHLLTALADGGSGPAFVLHDWSRQTFGPDHPERLGPQLGHGFYSLFHLGKALTHQSPKAIPKVRILYVYSSPSNWPQPQYGAVYGFANSLRLEDNRLFCKVIALGDEVSAPDRRAALLVRELTSPDRHMRVRYDGDARFIKQLEAFTPAATTAADAPVPKRNGVYLITGGLGGLGLIFADFLARHCQARLVLTGRSAPNAEAEAKLQDLQALGAEVLYRPCDVAVAADVDALVGEIKSRFGGIDGVIHSAGVIRRGFIRETPVETIQAVLAPKLFGTLNLDQALKNENLDFFVLFSSISAEIECLGLPAYAFSNSFLDHFADYRECLREQTKRSGKTLAINWPLWKQGGMQPSQQTEKILFQTLGMTPLRSESGVEAFHRGLGFPINRFMLVEGDPDRIRQALLGPRSAYHHIRRPPPQRLLSVSEPTLAEADNQALTQALRTALSVLAADLLKKPRTSIDADETLYAFGFDSLSLTEFASVLNDRYQLPSPITPSAFFEHPSIAALSSYLLKTFPDEIAGRLDIAPPKRRAAKPVRGPVVAASATSIPASPRAPIPRAGDSAEAIAIIGMDGRFPQSQTLEAFWQHLVKGDNLVTEIPPERWDWRAYYGDPQAEPNKTNVIWGGFLDGVDLFDPLFFGISPREAELMDPQQRLFLEASWRCVEAAGYRPSALAGTRTGVFVGITNSGYRELIAQSGAAIDAYVATGAAPSMIANRVSYVLDLRGPSEPVDTACSSSLVALHRAVRSIQLGDCDMAIAGGVNVILSPLNYIYLSRAGVLSPTGRCSSFDRQADGFVRSEGVAAVLLKPLSRAIADGDQIHAVIRATAVNHGGHANSLTAPNTAAQADLLIDAYTRANVDPASVGYIEAHGTGTKLGDPVEINALKKAFATLYAQAGRTQSETPTCGVGSVKTNAGHLEAAAGMAGLIKTILAIQHKTLPGNIHFREQNPYIDLEGSPFYIVRETQAWTAVQDQADDPLPRRAGISSFGFGGANAHIVLEEFPAVDAPVDGGDDPEEQIFVLSAKTPERLRAHARSLADHLHAPSIHDRAGDTPPAEPSSIDLLADLRRLAAAFLGVEVQALNVDVRLSDHGFDHVTVPRFQETLTAALGVSVGIDCFLIDPSLRQLADDLMQTYGQALHPRYAHRADPPPPAPVLARSLVNAADLAYTLQIGRDAMPERLAIVCRLDELAEKLERFSRGETGLPSTHTGSVTAKPEVAGLLADQVGAELLEMLTNAKALQKMASLWTLGVDIDWTRLHAGTQRRRLCLPAYPFAQERYWVVSTDRPVGAAPPPEAAAAAVSEEWTVSEAPSDPLPAPSDPPLRSSVIETIAGILKVDPSLLDPDQHFEAYGLTSLIISQLNAAFKEHFPDISPTVFFIHKSINELCSYLEEHHADAVKALAPPPTGRRPSSPAVPSAGPSVAQPVTPAGCPPCVAERKTAATASTGADPTCGDIAIIGMSGSFPMAPTIDEFWENLKAGKDCVTEIPPARWTPQDYPGLYCRHGGFLDDFDAFDPSFFNISPNRASVMPPQERLFLQVAWSCIEDAGYAGGRLADPEAGDRRGDVGVFAGVCGNEYQLNAMEEWAVGRLVPVSNHVCSVANRVSYFLNLRGPSLSVDTACSSALYALHLACESLRRGECAMAIAGGVNVVQHPAKYLTLCSVGMLSRTGRCNAFGDGADGMVPAEAVGAVLLKPREQAEKDGDMIYALIRGSAVNHDGKTYGYTVPNPVAQTEVIEAALAKSGVDPSTISYVEAHGTGTSLGDPIEIEGLSKAYRALSAAARTCAVGSVKSNIGHPESAAGIVQVIKVILQMRNKTLVPSVLGDDGKLNPKIPFAKTPFYVQRHLAAWQPPVSRDGKAVPRRAGITSMGASGVNVHLIMEEYPPPEHNAEDGGDRVSSGPVVVPISARQADRLQAYADRLAAHLRTAAARGQRQPLASIAFSLQTGRDAMPCRAAFVVETTEALIARLEAFSMSMAPDPTTGTYYGTAATSGVEATAPLQDARACAEHWVKGGTVPWETLYDPAKQPRRVSLPGYQFAKQRYWTTDSKAPGIDLRRVDGTAGSATAPALADTPFPDRANPVAKTAAPDAAADLLRSLADMPENEQTVGIAGILQEKIAVLLGHDTDYRPPIDDGLFAMGVESIQIMELQADLAQFFRITLSDTALFEYPDIRSLSAHIRDLIPFDHLVARHAIAAGGPPTMEGALEMSAVTADDLALLSEGPIPDDILAMDLECLTAALDREIRTAEAEIDLCGLST